MNRGTDSSQSVREFSSFSKASPKSQETPPWQVKPRISRSRSPQGQRACSRFLPPNHARLYRLGPEPSLSHAESPTELSTGKQMLSVCTTGDGGTSHTRLLRPCTPADVPEELSFSTFINFN